MPYPCGFYGDLKRECRCSPTQIQRYRSRISGPLLDRIDLHVEAPALSVTELRAADAALTVEIGRLHKQISGYAAVVGTIGTAIALWIVYAIMQGKAVLP